MNRRLGIRLPLALVAAAACLGAAHAQSGLRFEMMTIRQGRPGWWSATAGYARFLGRSPLEDLATGTLQRAAAQNVAEFAAQMKDPAAFPSPDGSQTGVKPQQPYELTFAPVVSLARPAIISVYFAGRVWSGGAHPNAFYAAYSFGVAGGRAKVLTLDDLFRPGTNGAKIVSDRTIAHLRQDPEALWVQDGTIQRIEMQTGEAARPVPNVAFATFVITPTALTVLIQPYQVGPYTSGSFSVKLPFSEFRDTLDPAGPLESLLR